MGNKEYKTSEEVKQRAEEAIGHTFKEIFELARKYQQENGLKEKHGKRDMEKAILGRHMRKVGSIMRVMKRLNRILKKLILN